MNIAASRKQLVRNTRIRRGEIYDSKYRPVAINIPSHNLYLISGKITNIKALGLFLNVYFGINQEELHDLVFQQRFKTYEESLLVDNIPSETVLALSERMNYYPELVFRNGTTRQYLYPNHFLATWVASMKRIQTLG